MKKNTSPASKPVRLSDGAEHYLRKIILLLSFGACGVRLVLSVIRDILLTNLGSSSLPVQFMGYINEAFSACALFALMCAGIYALLAGLPHLLSYAMLMQSIALVTITVLAGTGLTWLLALINETDAMRDAPFDISNYTLSSLQNEQLIYILSFSFLSVIVLIAIMLISLPFIKGIKNGYDKQKTDLSVNALAKAKWQDSPAAKPCIAFAAVFTAVSLISQIADTVQLIVSEGTPVTVSDYILLATPYFTLVIYVAAGLLTMQLFYDKLASKMLEFSK